MVLNSSKISAFKTVAWLINSGAFRTETMAKASLGIAFLKIQPSKKNKRIFSFSMTEYNNLTKITLAFPKPL